MAMDELHTREQRAQDGVLQFAEEMQAIRNGKLYPNPGKTDAWKTYCEQRWGMSKNAVDQTIRALPVLLRVAAGHLEQLPTMTAAAAVATLPEPVQDAILADEPKRDVVKARAKAARKAIEHGASEEQVAAKALAAKPKPKKSKLPTPEVPEDLRPENLPPKLTPEDHGWAPRKLVGQALLALWQARQKGLDDPPPSQDHRSVTIGKVEKLIDLATVFLADLRGEGSMFSDEEIKRMLEEAQQ